MSTFGRYIPHPSPGTSGRTALVDANLPLDAGRMLVLGNNAQHLCEQNPRRSLRQHPGVRDFYAAAFDGSGSPFTTAPEVRNIVWYATQKDGACCIDLGDFHVWRFPSGSYPKVTLKFTTQVEGGHSLGWVFAVSPGQQGPLSALGQASGVTTSATWDGASASVDLDDALLRPLAYTPTNGVDEVAVAEGGSLLTFRAFFGAYCSSNTDASGSRANVVALSLYLEPR